ncbi:MAG: phage virion morphogenesis protein [Thermodesulfovibrionales bacterium]
MSGITIDVRIDDGEVRALLLGIRDRIGNLKPAMSVVGQIVRSSVVRNFEAGGRPSKWPMSQRARKEDGKTLVDTARLRSSINARAFADHAEIGTNVVYAAIHQFGGPAGRGRKVTIPARPYLMIQDEDWTEITAELQDYILKGAK